MFYWAPLINFLVLPLMESLAPGCSSCLINKHKRKYEKKFFSHVFSSQNLKFQNQALSTWTRSPRGRKSTCKIRYQFFVSSTKKNNASFSFGKKNAWALAWRGKLAGTIQLRRVVAFVSRAHQEPKREPARLEFHVHGPPTFFFFWIRLSCPVHIQRGRDAEILLVFFHRGDVHRSRLRQKKKTADWNFASLLIGID